MNTKIILIKTNVFIKRNNWNNQETICVTLFLHVYTY